jgi:hypothetical protein
MAALGDQGGLSCEEDAEEGLDEEAGQSVRQESPAWNRGLPVRQALGRPRDRAGGSTGIPSVKTVRGRSN